MRLRAGKIKTITLLQTIMLQLVEPNLTAPADHVNKFFTLMMISTAAGSPRLDNIKVRLHNIISKGQHLNSDSRLVRKLLPKARRNVLAGNIGVSKERLHISFVK